tara:strand:- start:6484 stop:7131 length:648 start_codon:yes stop_codon:yes gene_type:complete
MAMTDNLFNSSDYSSATPADYLDDINEVLESIGEFPVTTAPTTSAGTMIHERALRFLERANTRVQAQGWPCNTKMSESIANCESISESDGFVVFLQGSGADGHRTLTLRRTEAGGPRVYDADAGTELNTAAGAVTVDVVRKLRWDVLPDLLQANIVSSAALDMQRRLQGSPQADAFYQQEKILRDQSSERMNPMKKNSPLMNTQPLQQQQAPQQG